MQLKTKQLLIGTFIAGGLLGASACSTTDNNPETAQTISERRATEIALAKLKGGVVTNSHVDENEGANKYEVNILKGEKIYEVDVDSLTGKILEINQSGQGKMNVNAEGKLQNVSPKVSSEEARQIALDQARGTITELDLDCFNNRLVYDIEISSTYHREVKVIVDAMNGKVLKLEEM
jgi:uncharacterized membrane protein YkoI